MDNIPLRFMYPIVLVLLHTLNSVHSQTNQYGQEGGSIRLVCPLSPPATNGRTTWRGPPSLIVYFIDEQKNPNIARGESLSVVRNLISGAYDLQITGLTRAMDVGEYKCDVNTIPTKEHKMNLDLYFGPDTVSLDGITGLQENKTMKLRCTADESNNASVLSWRNNSSPLSVNTPVSTSSGINNGVTTSQTYTKVLSRHDHRSVITCTASNGDIMSTNSTILDVKYSPRVSLSPSSLITVVGQKDVTLQCILLEANPQQVSFYWKPTSSTSPSNVFKITEITKANEGQYECEAGNSAGRSPVARAQITVQ